jgi:hypothetical protein
MQPLVFGARFLMGLLWVGISVGCHDVAQAPESKSTDVEWLTFDSLHRAELQVGAYIRRTKHWPRSDYRIDWQGYEGDELKFLVSNKDDFSGRLIAGGDKSVSVFVDERRLVVTRELGFQ